MIHLDRSSKRSEMNHAWRSNREVLIYLIYCMSNNFGETARSIIVITLADEGLGIDKEGMVIASWTVSRNPQTDTSYQGVDK